MKTFAKQLCIVLITLLFAFSLQAQSNASDDPLLQILQKELNRNMAILGQKKDPVYLLSYRVEEIKKYNIGAVFGNLTRSDSSTERVLTVQVRIGNYEMDNYRELKNSSSYFYYYYQDVTLPITNDEKAIEQILWRETDKAYNEALKNYESIKTNVAVTAQNEDSAPDYSATEDTESYYEPPLNVHFYAYAWENKVRGYSALFQKETDILEGESNFRFSIHRKYFVNSEGVSIVENQPYAYLYVSGLTQAEDGMKLPLSNTYFAHTPGDLPPDNLILEETKNLISTLLELRYAPIVEPYTCPALLSEEAAGVFFHEIFGHRVEGLRMKSESDGQTFKKQLGSLILNPNFSIIFDPTIRHYRDIPLNGSYIFDDEGVRGERVEVVKDGILKNFLMTRTPIDNAPTSNGHARAAAGEQPVSRQSNLIVETSKSYTDTELRQMLIKEAKAQNKEYGYLFKKVQGGFTTTGRYFPNSFNVTPQEVYRIYVDDREDELVRGVDLVGTPLSMFAQIEAAGKVHGSFAGQCGAESGSIPVSCCSPALFVKSIEIQKKAKSQERLPIVERFTEKTAQYPDDITSVVFVAMKDEIDRNLKELSIDKLQSPYFISYLITDATLMASKSSLGGVIYSEEKKSRDQETTVLVGNRQNNNLHFLNEDMLFGSNRRNPIKLSTDNQYDAIRNSLWASTNLQYKQAAEQMEAKNTAIKQQNISEELLQLPDYAIAFEETNDLMRMRESIQLSQLESLSIQLSKVFLDYPNFNSSHVEVFTYQADAYFRSSEMMQYVQPFNVIAIRAYATTISPDGEILTNYFTHYATRFDELLLMDELLRKIKTMADELEAVRKAPVVEEFYSGPVMFIGEAVGQIVAQAFIENQNGLLTERKSIVSDPGLASWGEDMIPQGNATEKMIGKKVISRNLSVKALDGMQSYHGIPLIGHYKLDAEGIRPPSSMSLITEGVLENMLNDRIPTLKFRESNGHKRLALSSNRLTTSLCSGVIELTGKSKSSYEKMKKTLIALAKEEDSEYAYIVTKLPTYPSRDNYYQPILMIRVSVKDGSETLVRMGKVSALSMKSFKQVIAISNQQQVYNTLLGGKNRNEIWGSPNFNISGVPTSFIVPTAILFKELEVTKEQNIMLRKAPEVDNPLKP